MSVEWEQRGANVTETGETVEATAFRIAFNEATAHLYERAEMLVTRSEGGLANRVNPEILICAHLFAAMQNGIRQ